MRIGIASNGSGCCAKSGRGSSAACSDGSSRFSRCFESLDLAGESFPASLTRAGAKNRSRSSHLRSRIRIPERSTFHQSRRRAGRQRARSSQQVLPS